MTKKIFAVGSMGLLAAMLYASPALAKHRHAFEGGFLDEAGRIGAHAAANLGANLLGSVLYGSGLAYGTGGYPYGGRGRNYPSSGYYDRSPVEHHHHHHYRDRIIEKKIYIYDEYYPRRRHHRHDHGYDHRYDYEEDDCD